MQKELAEFIASERDSFDIKHNNMFAFSFAEVGRYYNFLLIIYERHDLTLRHYHKIFNEIYHFLSEQSESQYTNEEHNKLNAEMEHIAKTVQLDIESFYLFAKILLDKLSRAIEFYFGKAKKLSLDSHDDLVKCLQEYCEVKELTLNEDLLALAGELKKDISDFRDYQITHLKSPRTYRGTTGDGRMQLLQIYPTEKDEQKETRLLNSLLGEIEEYTRLIIAFIMNNNEKTALRLNTTV